jgi:hypothetical protein
MPIQECPHQLKAGIVSLLGYFFVFLRVVGDQMCY